MNHLFVPNKESSQIKELGFNEPCVACWQNDCIIIGEIHDTSSTLAPTWDQVCQWFREKHQLRAFIGWRPNAKKWDSHVVDMKLSGPEYVNSRPFSSFKTDDIFDTYEEARLDVIRKMIDMQSPGPLI